MPGVTASETISQANEDSTPSKGRVLLQLPSGKRRELVSNTYTPLFRVIKNVQLAGQVEHLSVLQLVGAPELAHFDHFLGALGYSEADPAVIKQPTIDKAAWNGSLCSRCSTTPESTLYVSTKTC
jgi:hypothetical protein